jgi:hypothetical protein
MRIWIASVAAVAVQPLVFAVRIAPVYFASSQSLNGIGFILVSVIVVAAVVVLTLGIPTFLLLRKFQRVSWASLAVAGFALGALPMAAFSWPRDLEGYSSGATWHGKYVDFYVNGVPTTYAWSSYGESVMYFGLHGLVGALVLYAVWRRPDPTTTPIDSTVESAPVTSTPMSDSGKR